MIALLKKLNRYVVYMIAGASMSFALLSDTLLIATTAAYTTGTDYTTLLVIMLVLSIALFGLLSKLLIFITYRLSSNIFLRKSGLLYPYPILFYDFEAVIYAFYIPGLLLCGAVHLPALFLPSFARVLSAVRHFMLWVTLVLTFRYLIKNYSHEYDKKTLAYSLFLVPMIMLGVSLGLIVVGLLR